MKEKKLKLEDFKVQSFITSDPRAIVGGQPPIQTGNCDVPVYTVMPSWCSQTGGGAECAC